MTNVTLALYFIKHGPEPRASHFVLFPLELRLGFVVSPFSSQFIFAFFSQRLEPQIRLLFRRANVNHSVATNEVILIFNDELPKGNGI